MEEMLPVAEVVGQLESAGLGFDRVESIPGSTYQDCSTVIIIPTRGSIHPKVVQSWLALMTPMNQKRALLFAHGHEVGHAYNNLIQHILSNPELSTWKYVLTLEDDNIPEPNAHLRLIHSIEHGHYDAVSGLYFTKGDLNMPMAYGDPEEYRKTGVIDFKPRDVREAIQRGNVMEVNGIAMGCALWRMDLFRKIPAPWFVTTADFIPGKGIVCMTQDLAFCERARRAACRFAVDFRVKVGHLDVNTGMVY